MTVVTLPTQMPWPIHLDHELIDEAIDPKRLVVEPPLHQEALAREGNAQQAKKFSLGVGTKVVAAVLLLLVPWDEHMAGFRLFEAGAPGVTEFPTRSRLMSGEMQVFAVPALVHERRDRPQPIPP